jgi:hypothetical protein
VTTGADLSAILTHVDIRIPCPTRTAWDLLPDLLRMASLTPEVDSTRWLTDGAGVKRAHSVAHSRGSGGGGLCLGALEGAPGLAIGLAIALVGGPDPFEDAGRPALAAPWYERLAAARQRTG